MCHHPSIESTEDSPVTLDTTVPQGELYYVYAYGSLDRIYTDPAAAVKRADNQTGVVLNRAQQYVWERGNKKTKIQMAIEDVLDNADKNYANKLVSHYAQNMSAADKEQYIESAEMAMDWNDTNEPAISRLEYMLYTTLITERDNVINKSGTVFQKIF